LVGIEIIAADPTIVYNTINKN